TATLRSWYERTESSFIREWLGQFMQEKPCPTCSGDRLRIETLSVFLTSTHRADTAKAFSPTVVPRQAADGTQLNIAELSRLTITDALAFVDGLRLTKEQETIAEPIVKELRNRLGFLTS